MGLKEELAAEAEEIFATKWASRDGDKVPEPENVQLGNDAVKLDAAVLYADLAESTTLVDLYKAPFAAEIYKAYLNTVARVIRSQAGKITAFDGDRIMGVFIGDDRCNAAARCALKINYCVDKIINPAIKKQYPTSTYAVRQAVGVDASSLLVARTGIRGSNDLVWVGRAANYAAKLCELREANYPSWITGDVFSKLDSTSKETSGKQMWEARTWKEKDITVYRSSWTWEP